MMTASILVLAATISAPNVRPWFDATLRKTTGITAEELCWGDTSSRGAWRLVDSNLYSTAAGLYAQPAALYERALRCGLYDGYTTRGAISNATPLVSADWAKAYTNAANVWADLSPSASRHVNSVATERLLIGRILADAAHHVFATDSALMRRTWSSRIPRATGSAWPTDYAAWTTAMPCWWLKSDAGYSGNSAWLYALPAFSRLCGAPFSASRSPRPNPLVYGETASAGILRRINRDGWLGDDYASDTASRMASVTNWYAATWPQYYWDTPAYGYTNAFATATGMSATNADTVLARLQKWSAAKSARIDYDAIGAANWAYAIIDTAYGEPEPDGCRTVTRSATATFTAPISIIGVSLDWSRGDDGAPRFISTSPAYAYATGDWTLTTNAVGSPIYGSMAAGVAAYEEPRRVSMSATLPGFGTNVMGYVMLQQDFGNFGYTLAAALADCIAEGRDIYHLDTHPGRLRITSDMTTWTYDESGWRVSSGDSVTISNEYGVMHIPTPYALHVTTLGSSAGGTVWVTADGDATITRTVKAGGPVHGAAVLREGDGWPTSNLWTRANLTRVTEYEIAARLATTNYAGAFALPHYDGDYTIGAPEYRAANAQASSHAAACQMRTNRITAAMTDIYALVATMSTNAAVRYDARAAEDPSVIRGISGEVDATTFARLISGGVIPLGSEFRADTAFVATNGIGAAASREYEATVHISQPQGVDEFVITSPSWYESAPEFIWWCAFSPRYEPTHSSTNYGGYSAAVLPVVTTEMTFDETRWGVFPVAR